VVLPNADDFEQEVRRRWAEAEVTGHVSVDVRSGDVHKSLGGYPGPNHRIPDCCQVMKRLMKAGDSIIKQPKSGQGASLAISFALPRKGSQG
jgi:hypothetical protein